MSIFVTSDLHLNDPNALALRPQFKTLEEHDQFVIDQYNSVVGKDDLVYILGDVGNVPRDKLISKCKQLNGRKILIRGNHDKMSYNDYRLAGFIEIYDHPVYYNDNIILGHYPLKECYKNP